MHAVDEFKPDFNFILSFFSLSTRAGSLCRCQLSTLNKKIEAEAVHAQATVRTWRRIVSLNATLFPTLTFILLCTAVSVYRDSSMLLPWLEVPDR